MATYKDRQELRAFLRARRSLVTPEAAGLKRGKRRLVPGLRREEVAALAGVGLTWYTWLEQGRDIKVSTDALERIAQALRLSLSDTSYLLALADPKCVAETINTPIAPPLQAALDHFLGPAFVVSAATDVLASNGFGEALYEFDQMRGKFARNILWRALMDPTRREFYVDFEGGLRNMLGFFRVNYARYMCDPRFEELIGYLLTHSPDFVRIWNDHETASLSPPYLLPVQSRLFGRLNFYSVRLTIPDDNILVLLTPLDEGTQSAMASWRARNLEGSTLTYSGLSAES